MARSTSGVPEARSPPNRASPMPWSAALMGSRTPANERGAARITGFLARDAARCSGVKVGASGPNTRSVSERSLSDSAAIWSSIVPSSSTKNDFADLASDTIPGLKVFFPPRGTALVTGLGRVLESRNICSLVRCSTSRRTSPAGSEGTEVRSFSKASGPNAASLARLSASSSPRTAASTSPAARASSVARLNLLMSNVRGLVRPSLNFRRSSFSRCSRATTAARLVGDRAIEVFVTVWRPELLLR